MRKFGLIGYPLSHSFSKKYFTNKFEKEEINDTQYELFPLTSISELPKLLSDNPDLVGLNVTIPYKEQVIPYLDTIDPKAEAIGAVNTIKIEGGKLTGYNTDYHGFKDSLTKFIGPNPTPKKALILGTGGASKAVKAALEDLSIEYQLVSREPVEGELSYESIASSPNHLLSSLLIVNTTPLGMSPNEDSLPALPYEQLTTDHLLYDLVYNPTKTTFMQKGIDAKCWVKNGLEMLHGQAEKSWEIWNK
ncbi:shikimate dehydrogenase [Roseivirga sp. E12]|uniref:shikimate dehydrogenase family protein n=1 Tax=Roseivirga sp. E12 TaxID=2819237 RepID=UPI001ABD1BB8|nr:shikimate dehydrogenase [Roseivirga sp. E12]MBO3699705.1 shikimate dehydrogenase [Roseivirga sp. E12]